MWTKSSEFYFVKTSFRGCRHGDADHETSATRPTECTESKNFHLFQFSISKPEGAAEFNL